MPSRIPIGEFDLEFLLARRYVANRKRQALRCLRNPVQNRVKYVKKNYPTISNYLSAVHVIEARAACTFSKMQTPGSFFTKDRYLASWFDYRFVAQKTTVAQLLLSSFQKKTHEKIPVPLENYHRVGLRKIRKSGTGVNAKSDSCAKTRHVKPDLYSIVYRNSFCFLIFLNSPPLMKYLTWTF